MSTWATLCAGVIAAARRASVYRLAQYWVNLNDIRWRFLVRWTPDFTEFIVSIIRIARYLCHSCALSCLLHSMSADLCLSMSYYSECVLVNVVKRKTVRRCVCRCRPDERRFQQSWDDVVWGVRGAACRYYVSDCGRRPVARPLRAVRHRQLPVSVQYDHRRQLQYPLEFRRRPVPRRHHVQQLAFTPLSKQKRLSNVNYCIRISFVSVVGVVAWTLDNLGPKNFYSRQSCTVLRCANVVGRNGVTWRLMKWIYCKAQVTISRHLSM